MLTIFQRPLKTYSFIFAIFAFKNQNPALAGINPWWAKIHPSAKARLVKEHLTAHRKDQADATDKMPQHASIAPKAARHHAFAKEVHHCNQEPFPAELDMQAWLQPKPLRHGHQCCWYRRPNRVCDQKVLHSTFITFTSIAASPSRGKCSRCKTNSSSHMHMCNT